MTDDVEPALHAAIGLLLIVNMVFVILFEGSGELLFSRYGSIAVMLATVLLAAQAPWSRRIFVLIGGALFISAFARLPEWLPATDAALRSAGSSPLSSFR